MNTENKFSLCEKALSPSYSDSFKSFSEEQKNTYCAMHELKYVQQNKYGIGKTFCLKTAEKECETVSITKTIGEGGSKKAVLLDNGQVLMFPNIDQDSIESIPYMWTKAIDNEANTAKFLEEIQVPGLNRKKAYLEVTSNEASYKLPVLISDSFEQYATKGWFVMDSKNPRSSFFSDKEKGHWEYDFKVWEEPIKPLVRDVATMVMNGFQKITGDAGNIVLTENDNGGFEFHYFGFDFGGKTGGNNDVPSETTRSMAQNRDHCSSIVHKATSLISEIVYQRLSSLDLSKEGSKGSTITEEFSYEVSKHFLTCDFIEQVLGETSHQHNSGEL